MHQAGKIYLNVSISHRGITVNYSAKIMSSPLILQIMVDQHQQIPPSLFQLQLFLQHKWLITLNPPDNNGLLTEVLASLATFSWT